MENPFRVYLKDTDTGEEIAQGKWHHSGAYVLEYGKGSISDVTFAPIGETPKDIGEQAYQGPFGFPPHCRCVKASDFPERNVLVKVWVDGETRDSRMLRSGTPASHTKEGGER